jgi:hypothetical protein
MRGCLVVLRTVSGREVRRRGEKWPTPYSHSVTAIKLLLPVVSSCALAAPGWVVARGEELSGCRSWMLPVASRGAEEKKPKNGGTYLPTFF